MRDLLLGVAGKPVFHSKSPVIFKSIFNERNINGTYFRILCADAQKLFSIIKSLGMNGVNATSPLKEKIFSALSNCDTSAQAAKSVNCIKNNDGILTGFSTDHCGVINPHTNLIDLTDKKILIAGAGGAARAALTGLKEYTTDITLINRSTDKAEQLAAEFNCSFAKFEFCSDAFMNCDVFISTLPADAEIPCLNFINRDAVLFDANYKNSLLEKYAAEKLMKFLSGEKWLINQAIPAYNIFTGDSIMSCNADVTEDVSYDKNVIFLTGFMCCGKSSVGIELAEKLGYDFIDMDVLIEERNGIKINEIFSKYGEKYFREIESEILHELSKKNKTVVSTGGGVILDFQNRDILRKHLTIWIYSDIEESILRDNGTRPLLQTEDKTGTAVKLFNERKKFYAECCSFMAYNNGEIEEVIDEVYEEICRI